MITAHAILFDVHTYVFHLSNPRLWGKKSSTEDLCLSLRHCAKRSMTLFPIETHKNSFSTALLMSQFDLEIWGVATLVLLRDAIWMRWVKNWSV